MAHNVLEESCCGAITAPASESTDGSLLKGFRDGSEDAATQLYHRYARRVHALIKARCPAEMAARFDADDIVQSVFRSFFSAARRGLYEVPVGDELWRILLVIALNKLRSQRAFHRAAKRDVRATAAGASFELALECAAKDESEDAFLQLALNESLARLPEQHRKMVELRIQGYEVTQIAENTGRSKRTVERLLQESRTRLDAILSEAD